jgi:putative transposase
LNTSKATKTIKQRLDYHPHMAAWLAATQTLFNQVAAFYFEVIQAYPGILDLNDQEALFALEKLTHAAKAHPNPLIAGNDPGPWNRFYST